MLLTPLEISNLIIKANDSGITFSYMDGRLTVRQLLNADINPELLEQIKVNKEGIKTYFSKAVNESDIKSSQIRTKVLDNITYYFVTPTQIYWLDADKDTAYKESDSTHGTSSFAFEVIGDFDFKIFEKSIDSIIKRHESLRSTFHILFEDYVMKIHEMTIDYSTEYVDLRNKTVTPEKILELINFTNHSFNLAKGPLFLVKLVQTEDQKVLVSFKIHHIITDMFSNQILLREILMLYNDIKLGLEPQLPKLNCQYKEVLFYINEFSKANTVKHKQYWDKLYKLFPPDLEIPWAKKEIVKVKDKISRRKQFLFDESTMSGLIKLANKFETNLFIVLQASFKSFIFSKTGQTDLLIGTYVLGRELFEAHNQVGCFARTEVIRTVFHLDDSFFRAIEKVKKANEDMVTYRAFSLINKMIEEQKLRKDNDGFWKKFWKINIQYRDFSSSYAVDDLSLGNKFTINAISTVSNLIIPIDMELEFIRSFDSLVLDLQYDSIIYTEEAINAMIDSYIKYVKRVLTAPKSPIIDIMSNLSDNTITV